MTIQLPLNTIIQGNTLEVLRALPTESVDMVVTSPPYWGLRSYGTSPQVWGGDPACQHEWKQQLTMFRDAASLCPQCHAWRGELGQEPFFYLFIEHLCEIFDEVKRVLKPTGTCWVNLGDTYASKGSAPSRCAGDGRLSRAYMGRGRTSEIQAKSLCQIPDRFAIEMTNRGWILRNELIWWKPNITPSSVKDRFTVDFEKIFFFSKSPRYYFEQQFEPSTNPGRLQRRSHNPDNTQKTKYGADKFVSAINPKTVEASRLRVLANGRNKRAVWRVPTGSFDGAHFAVYPPALIETPIRAGCPEFVCRSCGQARERILEQRELPPEEWSDELRDRLRRNGAGDQGGYSGRDRKDYPDYIRSASDRRRATLKAMRSVRETKGYTDCGCNAGFRPGIVLDPFMGSGTTALVALQLGRSFVGVELNLDYIVMAKQRIAEFRNR